MRSTIDSSAAPAANDNADLRVRFDALLAEAFPPDPPGLIDVMRKLRDAKAIYVKLHPETDPDGSRRLNGKGKQRPVSGLRFSEEVEKAAQGRRGWSQTNIDNLLRWLERVDDEVLGRIEGTDFERAKYLVELARIAPDYQRRLLDKWLDPNAPAAPVAPERVKAEGWWSTVPGFIDTAERFCVPGLVDLRRGRAEEILPRDYPNLAVDLVLFDPPYGIAYRNSKGATVANDADPKAAAKLFIPLVAPRLKDDAYLCAFARWDVARFWADEMKDYQAPVRTRVVWDKGLASGLGDSSATPRGRVEDLLVGHKGRPKLHEWVDEYGFTDTPGLIVKRDVDLWSHQRPSHDPHPTSKPVELGVRAMLNFSAPGDLVLDATMGCGPFAVAAIRTGRRYIGIELDEDDDGKSLGYFTVAVDRVKEALAARGPQVARQAA